MTNLSALCHRIAACGLALAVLACVLQPGLAGQAEAEAKTTASGATATSSKVASKNGLVHEDGQIRWYKRGKLQKNVKHRFKSGTYYFGKAGNAVRGKAVKLGKAYWIFGNKGVLLAPKATRCYKLRGGMFCVNPKGHPAKVGWQISNGRLRYIAANGRVQTGGQVQGIAFKRDGWAKVDRASKLKITVLKRIDKLTKSSWSRAHKLRACWNWINHLGTYVNSSAVRDTQNEAWVQRQALKTMNGTKRECYGVACSFAMMAFELGYDPTIHLKPRSHAWVTLNGKRYDSVQPFMVHPPHLTGVRTIKIVSYAQTNPKGKSTAKKVGGIKVPRGGTGWACKGGAYYYFKGGTMLKSRWITVAGKRYYLKGNGATATYAAKVKVSNSSTRKARFVFGHTRGQLLVGSKTRVVSLKGAKYRVSATGRAVSGWAKAKGAASSTGKRAYYLASGLRASGDMLIGSKLYAFGSKGFLSTKRTKALRAALTTGVKAKRARALLGKPLKTTKANSCRDFFVSVDGTLAGLGTDLLLEYEHLKVSLYKPPKSKTAYISYVEAA